MPTTTNVTGHVEALAYNITTNTTKIRLTVNVKEAITSMINSQTSDEFLELLPLDYELYDLCGREKYFELANAISENSQKVTDY